MTVRYPSTPADLLTGDRLFGSPDWAAPASAQHNASLWGGRTGSGGRRNRHADRHGLALLSRKALVYNGPGNTALTDVATADSYYGDAAMQLDTASLTIHSLRPAAVLPRPVNLTNRIVRFTYKPVANVQTKLDTLQINLYSSGSPASPPADYHQWSGASALRAGMGDGAAPWAAIGLPITLFTGVGNGADLTAVTWASVNIKSAGGSLSMQIGGLDDYPNPLTRGQVIFTFDDAIRVQATGVAELFAQYGFPAVLFPSGIQTNVNISSGNYTAEMMRVLQDRHGWQVASQAWSTESAAVLDPLSEDAATQEVARLRRWQAGQGLEGGHDGSYFSSVGWTDAAPIGFVFRKMFRTMSAFYNGAGSGPPFSYPETFPFPDPLRIRRMNAQSWTGAGTDPGSAIERNLTAIQFAAAHRAVHIGAYHNLVATAGDVAYDALRAQLDYCDANRATINVTTFDGLYERVGL